MRLLLSIFLPVCALIFSIPLKSQIISEEAKNPNEISIAVNHSDESQIVVGANIAYLFISSDSGQSWKTRTQKSRLGVYGDPSVYCNSKGVFFHAHLSKTKGKDWPAWFDRMVVQRSRKRGRRWNRGNGVGLNGTRMQDKEWLCGDENPNSPYFGNLYISWTEFDQYESEDTNCHSRIRFAVSNDEARTFSEPIAVSDLEGDCQDDDGTLEGATGTTGPSGEIYLVWAGRNRLWFDISKDGGRTFGKDREIATLHEGWTLDIPGINRSNGMPFLQCDPKSGRIYVVYGDQEGMLASVILLYSDDQGNNWTRIGIGQGGGHAFLPNLSFNPRSAKLGILYYQLNADTSLIQPVMCILDKNMKGSYHMLDVPFSPPGKNIFFGDYIDIDYFGEGFMGAWMSYEERKMVVRIARVMGTS